MKRRYLTILMALLLSLCFAACGSTSEGISRTQALFSKYSKETGELISKDREAFSTYYRNVG